MHEDGRLVLCDFEISREVKHFAGDRTAGGGNGIPAVTDVGPIDDYDDVTTTVAKSGTRGFMAPEVRMNREFILLCIC